MRPGRRAIGARWEWGNRTALGWGALALLGFFALESAFAVFRELVLAPRLGERVAGLVGLLQAELLLALVAWLLFRALQAELRGSVVGLVAAEWLFLGVALEGLIGRFVRGLAWRDIAAGYVPARGGGDGLLVAASLLLVPLMVGAIVLKKGPPP